MKKTIIKWKNKNTLSNVVNAPFTTSIPSKTRLNIKMVAKTNGNAISAITQKMKLWK